MLLHLDGSRDSRPIAAAKVRYIGVRIMILRYSNGQRSLILLGLVVAPH